MKFSVLQRYESALTVGIHFYTKMLHVWPLSQNSFAGGRKKNKILHSNKIVFISLPILL